MIFLFILKAIKYVYSTNIADRKIKVEFFPFTIETDDSLVILPLCVKFFLTAVR